MITLEQHKQDFLDECRCTACVIEESFRWGQLPYDVLGGDEDVLIAAIDVAVDHLSHAELLIRKAAW